ncbi:MAG: phosphoribosyl 1,2-cyclic phosphate phosphodiesterase [Bacteroidales bacterium]|jgi:phosphoribosyl 1,2-cyclic phosphate phosphodiesterase|nr:phosphoribosyl 1,2-cyclic phosphate phosphodiesterase [Bacteroidales bacterium]
MRYFASMKTAYITILGSGTSQGVPVIGCRCSVCSSNDKLDKRLRASILIESAEATVVVDTGPDFRQQMLREKVTKMDAVLITHCHKDHIAGMDDVRSFNFLQKKAMPIYASPEDQKLIKTEFSYAFAEKKYPGVPSLDLIDMDENLLKIKDLNITPIRVMHRYLPVFAFRIGNFAYITDANYISPESFDALKGIDILVIDSVRKEKHISHFSLGEAIEVARKLEVKKTYFTHISHLMGKAADVNAELPDGMLLAWDGLKIKITY